MNERIDLSKVSEEPELPPGWHCDDMALGGKPPDGSWTYIAKRLDGLQVRPLGSSTVEKHSRHVETLLGRRPYVMQLAWGAVRLLRSPSLVEAVREAERACPLAPLWLECAESSKSYGPVDLETGELRFADRGAK